MGFLDFFFQTDINAGLAQFQADPKGVLLDVRTREEYTHGHIPGSQNLPLQEVTRIGTMVPDQSTPLYVHCYSGARSGRAVTALRRMGYSHVSNIGGIRDYRGKTEGGN